MSELSVLVREGRALRAAGKPLLLATVVSVAGSAYRRPGARMLVSPDRWVAGSISGGCLEGDIVTRGFWRTEQCHSVVVTFDTRDDEDPAGAFGLGCEGVVAVLLERLDAPRPWDPLEVAARCFEREEPAALATVYRSCRADVPVGAHLALEQDAVTCSFDDPRLRDGLAEAAEHVLRTRVCQTWTDADGSVEALVEPILPPPHLFVWGSGHDVVPVVAVAKALQWRVSVFARHGRYATIERFAAADRVAAREPGALRSEVDASALPAAVVMSHRYEEDREALRALLGSRAMYIGMLGPRRRTERILEELRRRGPKLNASALKRLHAPAGLHIGAESPHEIALSIVAEAQATLAGAPAGRLRDRRGSIHEPVARSRGVAEEAG
jgi:xanthine dehydrogenase accessory factor